MIYNRTPYYVIKTAVDKSGGVMVALQVPAKIAKKLALDGGQEASSLHITLAYLGKASQFAPGKMNVLHDIMADVARTTAPVEIELTGYGVFPETDDGPCLHVTVADTGALDSLRETVVEAVSSYGMPPMGKGAEGDYVPHITLAYGESAAPPETLPVKGFTADWLYVTMGKTEALMRMVKKDAMTTGNSPAGIIAPGQGMWLNKPKQYSNTMKSVAESGKAVAIDFDGTITTDDKGTENPSMRALVDDLLAHKVRVVIFTARPASSVRSWLKAHNWPSLDVTNVKSPDFGVYLDDRAMNFDPTTVGEDLAAKLSEFKTWWEKTAKAMGSGASDGAAAGVYEPKDEDGNIRRKDESGAFVMSPAMVMPIAPTPNFGGDPAERARREREAQAQMVKDSSYGEPMAETPISTTNLDTLSKQPRRKPIDGQVYTATTTTQIDTQAPGLWKEENFDEAKHPRAEDGKFSATGGGGAAAADEATPKPAGDNAFKPEQMPDAHPAAGIKSWDDMPVEYADAAKAHYAVQWAKNTADNQKPWNDRYHEGELAFKVANDSLKLNYAQGLKPEELDIKRHNLHGVDAWGGVPKDMQQAAQVHYADQIAGDNQDQRDNAIAMWGHLTNEQKLSHAQHMNNEELNRYADGKLPWNQGKPTAPKQEEWQPNEPKETEPEESETEPEESESPVAEVPQEWGELGGPVQMKVYNEWRDRNRDEWVQGEIDNWREDDENFRDAPDKVEGGDVLKEVNENFYAGDAVSGLESRGNMGELAAAEEKQRIAEWHERFDVDASYEAGAFAWDGDGKLSVTTELLVFKDNPYEGPAAEQQQFLHLPGITRQHMSDAYKLARWNEVKDDFEGQFKDKFGEAVDQQIENMKEHPPEYILDNVNENMSEAWDNMDDREKFEAAKRFKPELFEEGRNNNSGQEGKGDRVKGTVGPDPDNDTNGQKEIQAKTPKKREELGGGISESWTVTMGDGSEYVWKPSMGEDGDARYGIPAGEQYTREVAARDIAVLVGMKNLMPEAAITQYKGDYGVMMVKIPDADNDGTRGDSDFEDTARRGTFLDYIIGNTDRHGGNYMTDSSGKLWLIDHGLSFSNAPDSDKPRYAMWRRIFGDQDRNPAVYDAEIKESVRKPWRDKWDKIEAAMKRRGIGKHAIEGVKERYDHAMSDGVTWGDILKEGSVY